MVKIERSYPAPESLERESKKINGSYKEIDVIQRLRLDFHDKCYICETKPIQDPEVEHLLPHRNGKLSGRKYDWNNLFWCCRHCNSVKNNVIYDDGIIDCCKQDPETVIKVALIEDEVIVYSKDEHDKKSVLTADLIRNVFNLQNSGIRIAACETRIQMLQESMDVLYRELDNYRKAPMSIRNKKMLKALLCRESAYASFKRGYIRDRLVDYPELEEYVK